MTRKTISLKEILLALILLCVPLHQARATTTENDIIAIGRTLPLLTAKLTGHVRVAIIYNPQNPASTAEANTIMALMGVGYPTGGDITLVPELVSVGNLDNIRNASIALITSNLQPYYGTIFAATSAAKTLSASTDIECVESGHCVIGVITNPKVEILYNAAAAEQSSIKFGQAFQMLVKRV